MWLTHATAPMTESTKGILNAPKNRRGEAFLFLISTLAGFSIISQLHWFHFGVTDLGNGNCHICHVTLTASCDSAPGDFFGPVIITQRINRVDYIL